MARSVIVGVGIAALASAGCQRLACGPGTFQDGALCLALPPAVDTDAPDTEPGVDSAAPPDSDAPESGGADTDASDSDTDILGRPAYFGNAVFDDYRSMSAFCTLHEEVYGSLTVRGDRVTHLDDLACLRAVVGDLTFSAPSLRTVALPNLVEVTGDLKIEGGAGLVAVSAEQLARVGGHLRLGGDAGLTSLVEVALPVLAEVGADLWFDDSANVATLRLPVLASVGRHLWLRRHARLARVEWPLLTGAGGALRIEGNAALTEVVSPAFGSVGAVWNGELAVQDNPVLPSLGFLHGVDAVAGSLIVRRNAVLPPAEADALLAAIGAENIGGVVVFEANGAP